MVAKPASAEPPRKARPKSPAQAVAISNTDQVTPATIQTLRGPAVGQHAAEQRAHHVAVAEIAQHRAPVAPVQPTRR